MHVGGRETRPHYLATNREWTLLALHGNYTSADM